MGDFKPIRIEEIVIFIIDYGYRAKWKLIRYAIQYNIQYLFAIYDIYRRKKKNEENWWQKINGEKTWKKPRGL